MTGPVPAPEQQGEPACARCGSPKHHSGYAGQCDAPYHRPPIDEQYGRCSRCGAHPFEPTPPSSEEAEALSVEELIRAWREDVCDNDADRRSFDQLVAAIRSPLEERIRELEAIAFHTDGVMHAATEHIKALEEERDRLREALDNAGAALPEMLEMASNGEFLTGLWAQRLLDSHRRAEAAEAQVSKLREAWSNGALQVWHEGPCPAHPDRVRERGACTCGAGGAEAILFAETVQEGGETQ